MSENSSVTSHLDNDLFDIEVGLMLSEELKRSGGMFLSGKGRNALLGGSENGKTIAHRISGGVGEKTLAVDISTRASKGSAAGNMAKTAKRPEQAGRKSGSAKMAALNLTLKASLMLPSGGCAWDRVRQNHVHHYATTIADKSVPISFYSIVISNVALCGFNMYHTGKYPCC
jgi:hypothetical protein